MDILYRLTLLLHIFGFLGGVIALPILVTVLFDLSDFYDGLLISIIFTFAAPVIGWGQRWLFTGEFREFVPFQQKLISALPKDGNFAAALGAAVLLSTLIISSIETKQSRELWEREVFRSECTKENGEEVVLGYFTAEEGEEKGAPIYCSYYLDDPWWPSETLCEWNDGANAESPRCKRLAANPKPVFSWENFFGPVIFINLLVFYFLVLIRLIYNKRIQN